MKQKLTAGLIVIAATAMGFVGMCSACVTWPRFGLMMERVADITAGVMMVLVAVILAAAVFLTETK